MTFLLLNNQMIQNSTEALILAVGGLWTPVTASLSYCDMEYKDRFFFFYICLRLPGFGVLYDVKCQKAKTCIHTYITWIIYQFR